MKIGQLIHKTTGERAIGTADVIPACAHFSEVVEIDGEYAPEWTGDTEPWWDCQRQKTDPLTGEPLYVTESLSAFPLSEFVFVEDEQEGDT